MPRYALLNRLDQGDEVTNGGIAKASQALPLQQVPAPFPSGSNTNPSPSLTPKPPSSTDSCYHAALRM